jgi:hypothetical protein
MNKADSPLRFLYGDLVVILFNTKAVSYRKTIEEMRLEVLYPRKAADAKHRIHVE